MGLFGGRKDGKLVDFMECKQGGWYSLSKNPPLYPSSHHASSLVAHQK